MGKKDTQFKLRVDCETLDAARAKAKRLDVPLSQVLRQLLREWVAENEQPEEEEPAK